MSVLSDLDLLVLRDTNNPPLVNKGSELTYGELDNHAVALYNAVQSIVSGENVTAYDAGRTYDMFSTDIYDQFASYDSRIWKAIYAGSPSGFTGQTPAEGVYWTQVTLAELLPDVMKLADQASSGIVLKQRSVTIPSAQVLTLNSSPVTIVSGVSGKILVLVSAIFRATYNSATYATNTNIELRHTGSSSELTSNAAKLGFTANTINQFAIKADNASDQLISGANIEAFVQTGDPNTGDSDITIDVKYYEMDL